MPGRKFFARRPSFSPVLMPASSHAEEMIRKLPVEVDIEVTVVEKRQPDAHRLYFELCHRVAGLMNACGFEGEDRSTVDARFRVVAGICTVQPASRAVSQATGAEMIAIPRSISFAKMDAWAFAKFLDRCMDFTRTELLPRVPESEFAVAVGDLLSEAKRRAHRMEKEGAA